MTMDGLTNRLGALPQVGRPVVNRTGLTGLFDYDVTFSRLGPLLTDFTK